MNKKFNNIEDELDFIAKNNKGTLLPENVVLFAKDQNTHLHSKFEWDNVKAGHEYRLWQARQIIKYQVTTVKTEVNTEIVIPVWESLPSDRGKNGYRKTVDIMTNDEKKYELLNTLMQEINYLQKKYNILLQYDRHLSDMKLEIPLKKMEKTISKKLTELKPSLST